MGRLQRVAVIGLILAVSTSVSAWVQKPARSAPTRGASVVVPALPAVQQRVKRDQAEVMHLQRAVAKQASDSQRAGQRLQRQDQQIAELQRKLSTLRVSRTAGQP